MMKNILTAGIIGLSLVSVAMPTKRELKQVQGVVNELMAGDLQAMKAGRISASKVAANAENYAREAETEAAKFLFLKGAFGLYVQGGDYDEALRVLDVLNASVKNIPDKVMAEIVVAKLKRIAKDKGAGIFEYYERLERRMNMTEERTKLEKAVKENPSSREAHHDLAVCLAVLGDWPAALEQFAAAGGKAAEAAAAEKAGKGVTAADLWWEAAQGDSTEPLRAHAASLYRQALAGGKLTGLKLALAKKRLAEIDPSSDAAAEPAKEEEKSVAKPAKKTEPDRSRAAVSKGTGDWAIPARLKGVKTLDFDIGAPEKLTFVAVPAGETSFASMPDRRFAVKRPFWMSQLFVTLDQYRTLVPEFEDEKMDLLAAACKGDRTVAVQPHFSLDECEAFVGKLNEKYGAALPKGWAFRLLTSAEWTLVENGRRIPTFVTPDEARLAALKKKGFFKKCEDTKQMRKFWEGYGEFSPLTLLPEADKIRSQRKVQDFAFCGYCLCCDTLSVPGCPGNPFDPKVKELVNEALKADWRGEDPFWSCDAEEPERRRGIGNGKFLMVEAGHRQWLLRVAVGFDYEGEWKRQRDK